MSTAKEKSFAECTFYFKEDKDERTVLQSVLMKYPDSMLFKMVDSGFNAVVCVCIGF